MKDSMQKNRFKFKESKLDVSRMGLGTMQLTGPQAWGPPKDRDAAIRLLREALARGVNYIDTADFYGPHVINQLIKAALHPYPQDFVIATKVGTKRTPDRGWAAALSKEDLVSDVHDNLRNLCVDSLHIVNLRVGTQLGPSEGTIEEPLNVLIGLKKEGLIQQIGISNATPAQVRQAKGMVNIVNVQNHYNLAHRADDALIDELASEGVAFTPFFPLGGFRPIRSPKLQEVANALRKTPAQVALAWLLQRSPNILLIPGTASTTHLHENMEVPALSLPAAAIELLNAIQEDSGK